MNFQGQFNFGYPIVPKNIINTIPDEAVIPLSMGSSLQGNVLATTFENLKSQIASPWPVFIQYNALNSTLWNNGPGTHELNDTNVSFGKLALSSNVNGLLNTAIGTNALQNNQGGAQNTAVGHNTLSNAVNLLENTAVGNRVLQNLYSGGYNTGTGANALKSATTGSSNIAVGGESLVDLTTGINNTAVGYQSGWQLTVGSHNTMIGYQAKAGAFSGSVVLGYYATATANNQFVVGSTFQNAGAVTAEVNTSANVWNVIINGVARKILLA